MFKFLKSNNPIYFVSISSFILALCIFNHLLFDSKEILWPIFPLFNLNKYFFYLIYAFILFFSAIKINSIINKSVFFQKSNYATGLIYISLATSTYPIHFAFKPLIANLFCLLALGNLFKIYRNKTCKIEIFNAGCWLFISAIFDSNYIFIFPLAWMTLSIIRPFNWREYAMPFISLVFISIYLIVLLFYFSEVNFWIKNWLQNLQDSQLISWKSWWYSIFIFLFGVIIGSRTLFLSFIRSSNRYKKITWIFISLFFCFVLQAFSEYVFFNNKQPILFGFLIPFSVILSNTIINTKLSWLVHSFIIISIVGYFVLTYMI